MWISSLFTSGRYSTKPGQLHLRDEQVEGQAPPLPARPALEAAPHGDGQHAGAGPPALDDDAEDEGGDDRLTVLVVDDNPDICAYVREHLQSRYRVLEAADGAAALEAARSSLPDLVVSDVMMPVLDGFGLVRALKADPETDFIPVILLTAKATSADRIEGLEEGADDYLTKPFSVRELQARIENLIASRRKLKARLAALPRAAATSRAPAAGLSASDRAFLAQVQTAVEMHLSEEDFSVEKLAALVAQSRNTLHRRLKGLMEETPTAFIRRLRLEQAAALLAQQEGTISEVAYAVGFKSVSHFSQAFRRRYGLTPSQYVEAHAQMPKGG